MKPIIMDLKDISDSTEAYDERPNKIFTLFIYTLFVMVVITLIWACFWKLDIVVKGDGILKVKNSSNIISTEVTGRVTVSNIEEGIYVEEGEILLTIDHTKDDEKLQLCNDMLLQTEERLTILEGYMNFLNDDISDLNSYENNKYYEEYMNRLEIINNNKDADELTRENQIIQYKQNIKKIEETLTYYQNKKSKYNQAINCINNGENSFSEYDTYYYSLIEDYFLSYNTISEKYQNNEGIITDDGKRELSSLELEQISMLQQQITSIEETELTLNGNLETVQMDLLLISNGTEDYSNSALVLKEKNAISIDIANYEAKKKEVGEWVIEFTVNQKRLTQEQSKRLLAYAERMSFSAAGEANAYVQGLKTVGKRNKQKFYDYMQCIDWFPEGVNVGVLDGKIVSRILPSPLERLFGDKEWKSKKE